MQTEIEKLRAENLALNAKLESQDKLLLRKDNRIERLEEQIRLHLLARFGRKSEVYENRNQPPLFNEAESDGHQVAPEQPEDEVTIGPYTKKRGHRKPLPEFLPRERIEHDLRDEEKI